MTNKYIATVLTLIFLQFSCADKTVVEKTDTQNLPEVIKKRMRDSIEINLFDSIQAGKKINKLLYYEAIYKIDTLNLKYLIKYTDLLAITGQTQRSMNLLNNALKWTDRKAKIFHSKGNVWQAIMTLQQQRGLQFNFAFDSSYYYYERACKTDSTDAELFITLSKMHEFQKNYNEAILNIEQAIKIQPTNRTHYLYKGVYKYYLGDYKGAYEDLTPITDVRRSDYSWYYYRAYAGATLGKYVESVQDFDTCELLNYNSPDLYYNRGKIKTNITERKREGYLEIKKSLQMGYPVPKDEQDLINKKLSETTI